jgi:predicted SprT family Zn-dependent metalloprotease
MNVHQLWANYWATNEPHSRVLNLREELQQTKVSVREASRVVFEQLINQATTQLRCSHQPPSHPLIVSRADAKESPLCARQPLAPIALTSKKTAARINIDSDEEGCVGCVMKDIIDICDSDDDDDDDEENSRIIPRAQKPIPQSVSSPCPGKKVAPTVDQAVRSTPNKKPDLNSKNQATPFVSPKPLVTHLSNNHTKSLKGGKVSTTDDGIPDDEVASMLADVPSATREFSRTRAGLADLCYKLFNKEVFEHKLPATMDIRWNSHFTTTAGRFCGRLQSNRRVGYIELSSKIITNQARLHETLAHEMCHAATWIIDNYFQDNHADVFMKYASKCKLRVHVTVTKYHTFDLEFKYVYRCGSCGYEMKRMRNTLGSGHLCGKCGGEIKLVTN